MAGGAVGCLRRVREQVGPARLVPSPPPPQELLGCLRPTLEPKATDFIPQARPTPAF